MIDLYTLLHGTPAWAEVQAYFQGEEFPEERFLVDAIKKHLLTPDQATALTAIDVSLETLLNGRFPLSHMETVRPMLADWNARLGCRYFYGI